MGFVLPVASTVMYYAEHGAQPDVFASIPHAMWWGIVTLTTVGYGDVVPVTVLGRMMAGLFAVTALFLIAVPTAILGAGFMEEMEVGEPASSEDRRTGSGGAGTDERSSDS
ncbi:MAG: potassium channel family protein [Candidatus Palauibacterales bacterium]|nr:potassium channel family protein [Candidatus Palauibacterales bacterium]